MKWVASRVMLGRLASITAYSALLAAITVTPVILGSLLFHWSWPTIFTGLLVSGISVTFFSLRLLAHNKYVITGRSLDVTTSGRTKCVLFSSVIRVERVRHRIKGTVQEWVRIIYRQGARQLRVEVRPEDSSSFVYDLVSKCPQLTSFDQRKLPYLGHSDSDSERTSISLVCA